MSELTVAGVLRDSGFGISEDAVARAFAHAFASDLIVPGSAALSAGAQEALRAGGMLLDGNDQPYEKAVEQTAAEFASLVAASLPLATVAAQMNVSRVRAQQLLSRGELWGIRVDRKWRLPRLQFGTDGRPVPGLAALLAELGANDRHPMTVLGFLTSPQPELDLDGSPRSPLQWLALGGSVTPILDLVEDFDVLA